MAFSLSTLTTWVKQNPDKFYTSSVLGAKTAKLIKDKGVLMTGVKNAETINIIDTDALFQSDSCGWSTSGTTTLTQRTVTVGKVKIQEALCIKSLETYFTSQALALGSEYKSDSDLYAAIADKFFQKKLDTTAAAIEKAIWQGDTAVGNTDGQTNKWDGFIKLIKATNTPVIVNSRVGTGTIAITGTSATVNGTNTVFTSQVAAGDKIYVGTTLLGTVSSVTNDTTLVLTATATQSSTAFNIFKSSQVATTDMSATPLQSITESNVLAILKAVYKLIPTKLLDKDDLRIFVGMNTYRLAMQALVSINWFHYKPADNTPMDSFVLPGTNIIVEGTPGLNDTNEIYAMRLSNMAMGVDMVDDADQFEFVYSEAGREHRYSAAFKCGVNVAFPDEIVRYQNIA